MPRMNKSQFELIATVLREYKGKDARHHRAALAEQFADALAKTQAPGQFDRERFIRLVTEGPEVRDGARR